MGLILVAFSSHFALTIAYNVCYNGQEMNEVQSKIAELEAKGWTLAAIADELQVAYITVQKWKAGERNTRLEKPVLDSLDRLLGRKRIPKQRRYHHEKRST